METTVPERELPPPNKKALILALAALAVAVVALLSSWWNGSNRMVTDSSPNRYTQIQKRGIIRACYYVGAPYFVIDPKANTKSGIFYEVVELAAKKLSFAVEWVGEVGFGEMPEALSAGKCDVIGSGVWISGNRGARADFSIPVLYDSVNAYVRIDDHRYDENPSSLDSPAVRISTIDGEMAAVIAASDYPRAALLSLPQTSDFTQMILNVTSKKADVTFLARGPALKFMAANPDKIRELSPTSPVRVFPTAIMLPQNEYTLKAAIDAALIELLNNGDVERIIRKYEEHPGAHLRVLSGFSTPPR